jgi:hypothetical protein
VIKIANTRTRNRFFMVMKASPARCGSRLSRVKERIRSGMVAAISNSFQLLSAGVVKHLIHSADDAVNVIVAHDIRTRRVLRSSVGLFAKVLAKTGDDKDRITHRPQRQQGQKDV